MKVNQLKMGSLLSYAQMGLGIIISLVYTPVMIRLLGKSEYGLYNTVSSTISMLSILSLGFNSSYIRYFTKYKQQNDQQLIDRLNGLFLFIYLIISAVALFCGLYLTNHLNIVFDEGLTAQEYSIAKVLMFLLTINLAASFPMSVFSSIISAHEKFIFLKLLSIGKTVLGPFVTLPLLLMGYRSIAMVTVTVAISLGVDIAYLVYVLKVLKQRFVFGRVEKGLFGSIFGYTLFIALNMIVDQINWNVGKLLLGRFHGTEAVAVYSVGYSLYHYYQIFSTSVSHVFTPRIHRIVEATRFDLAAQRAKLTSLFIQVGRIQFLILSLIATGVLFFGKPFILNVWAGDGYEDAYYVAVLLIFSASIALIQNLGIEIQRAQNLHHFRSIVYIIMALINLCLTIVLCQKYSSIGSAVGTSLSLIIANGLIMNIYYHKKCKLDILAFWKSIIRLSVGLIVPIIGGLFIVQLMNLNALLQFFLGIVLYTFLYCISMWFVGMNQYEKDLIIKVIRKAGIRKSK